MGKNVDDEGTLDDCAKDDLREDGGVTTSKELLDTWVEVSELG